MNEGLIKLKEKIEDINAKINVKQVQENGFNAEAEEKLKTIFILIAKIKEKYAAVKECEKNIQYITAELKKTRDELSSNNKKNKGLETQLGQQQEGLKQLNKEKYDLIQQIEGFKNDKQLADNLIKNLTQENEKLIQELEKLKTENASLQTEKEGFEPQKLALAAQIDKNNAKMSDLESQITNLNKQLDEHIKIFENKDAEITYLKTKNQELTETIVKNTGEKDLLQTQINELKAKEQNLQTELEKNLAIITEINVLLDKFNELSNSNLNNPNPNYTIIIDKLQDVLNEDPSQDGNSQLVPPDSQDGNQKKPSVASDSQLVPPDSQNGNQQKPKVLAEEVKNLFNLDEAKNVNYFETKFGLMSLESVIKYIDDPILNKKIKILITALKSKGINPERLTMLHKDVIDRYNQLPKSSSGGMRKTRKKSKNFIKRKKTLKKDKNKINNNNKMKNQINKKIKGGWTYNPDSKLDSQSSVVKTDSKSSSNNKNSYNSNRSRSRSSVEAQGNKSKTRHKTKKNKHYKTKSKAKTKTYKRS